MKKILFVFLFTFFFLFFFLFAGKNYSLADADCISNNAGAGCISSSNQCPANTTRGGQCKVSDLNPDGVCCVSNSSGTGTGASTGTGTGGNTIWGAPGSGPSLWDVSNLLGAGAPNNASNAGFNSILSLLISLLILAAIILSLFYLIWGGFDWMASGGDKQKLQSARHKITFAIIGLVIVFLAFFIINVITSFFGIKGGF